MSGDPIHIKTSHRGLLHKELGVPAGKKLTGEQINRALHSQDAATRKRAQFAKNAKSWHY